MTNALPIIASNSIAIYRMIWIRIVVNQDDIDVGGVALDKITSPKLSVTGIELGALSFIDSNQVIGIVSDVTSIELKFSNGVIMLWFIGFRTRYRMVFDTLVAMQFICKLNAINPIYTRMLTCICAGCSVSLVYVCFPQFQNCPFI